MCAVRVHVYVGMAMHRVQPLMRLNTAAGWRVPRACRERVDWCRRPVQCHATPTRRVRMPHLKAPSAIAPKVSLLHVHMKGFGIWVAFLSIDQACARGLIRFVEYKWQGTALSAPSVPLTWITPTLKYLRDESGAQRQGRKGSFYIPRMYSMQFETSRTQSIHTRLSS